MSDPVATSSLEVRKDNWGDTRIVTDQIDGALGENEVLFKVDRLALTSNNISYAAAGDSLGYWRFFPAADGWGRIPAMGWGDVIASAHPEVLEGERVWGFFPMSTHLKILADKSSTAQFHDVSPHRDGLAPVYSQFDRAATNPFYDVDREDQDSLLRGLFATSWLVEDFLDVNDYFSAGACLVTSASSKTSIALAHSLKQRGKLRSVGVTSARNVAFCDSLACYDEVVTYDDVQDLDASRAVVMVDMAGSAKVLSDVHHHFGDNMKHSCRIGATHFEAMGPVDNLPGATPEFFFAPTHIKRRSAELGTKDFMMRMGAAYTAFREFSDGWLKVERHYGAKSVADAYQKMLAGEVDPAVGQIISLSA
ncbi:MAG: DUF2855 family protein [Gammaproteobacteria bacterium]|nr:DUF2855 family protein [Gammaproteobacteria bacterium]